MSNLSRSVSRSTELLVDPRQDSIVGRRSWDSLVAAEKTTSQSMPSGAEMSGSSIPPVKRASCIVPGGSIDSKVLADQMIPRVLGTMPRNIVALSDRPITYEEELEDRLGWLRISSTTLYQRFAEERKKCKQLARQLNVRELSQRETIEKIRTQYEQRFERLKNRARLLVTRCEFFRNEKQLIEQRMAQVMDSAARERQGLERKIAELQEEVERLRSERRQTEIQELSVLRVTEEEKQRKERGIDTNLEVGYEHLKMLCEIAVARVGTLEEWIHIPNDKRSSKRHRNFDAQLLLCRRSSSCPTISTNSFDRPSFSCDGINQLTHGTLDLSAEPVPVSPASVNLMLPKDQSDMETAFLVKSSSTAHGKPVSSTHSIPPTLPAYVVPIRPTTIRNSLLKLFNESKTNHSDPSSFYRPSACPDSRRNHKGNGGTNGKCLMGRSETASDEEFAKRDFLLFDEKIKASRQTSKKSEHVAMTAQPKRHSSLPRVELFKKSLYVSNHDAQAFNSPDLEVKSTCRTLPSNRPNSVLLTKQERVLGIIFDRSVSDKLRPSQTDVFSDVSPLVTRTLSQIDNGSTDSLPEKIEGVTNGDRIAIKRNRSVHSTFGRLHQRRNGITDIACVEPKVLKSPSALDSFGKNLKHYLQ